MSLEIQYALRTNPEYLDYLRKHSTWYKVLNRSPEMFNKFILEFKKNKQQEASLRLSKALDTLESLQTILTTLK